MSNEVTIEAMNEVIARFMGGTRVLHPEQRFFNEDFYGYVCHDGRWWNEKCLKYQTSWDWLMPVVEKIESLENKRFGVCIDVLDTMIMDYNCTGYDEGEKVIIQTDIYPDNGDTKISITHAAVYQFITWYNDNQQKQNNDK